MSFIFGEKPKAHNFVGVTLYTYVTYGAIINTFYYNIYIYFKNPIRRLIAISFSCIFFLIIGVSNVMNVPVSPVLAALTLTAAILFAVVCIVLATIYRKHSHK